MIADLAIYDRGNKLLASFAPATDPEYVVAVAFRIQRMEEPFGEVPIIAEYLYQRAIHAVAIGRLEVRKDTAAIS